MNKTKFEAAGAKYWIYNPQGKKTIVAVHGLRGTHHGLEFIAKSLPQHRLIIPDLPGFGASPPLKSAHTSQNYATWLEKFMISLKLKEPPVLLGHSFGSIIAGEYASKNSEKISKLILINPVSEKSRGVGNLVAKNYYNLANLLPEKLGEKLLRSRSATRVMSYTMISTKEKHLKKRVYEQHFAYFATFSNRRAVSQAFHSASHSNLVKNTDKLDMPVLLIVGEKDIYAPLSTQKILHKKLKNSKLHIIPKVGHLVHYETPENAAQAINDFLS